MPSIQILRNYHLKIIFLVHFILIAISSMGNWSSYSYVFYNSILIIFFIWGLIDDQSQEPVQLAIVVNGASIILDILLLIMRFPDQERVVERFSVAMGIIHLLIRPFTTFFLTKHLDERSGNQGRRNESYEDLDNTRQPTTSAPTGAGGYDFSSAQQI